MESLRKLTADPRHFQILSLSILLGIQLYWGDFGPNLAIIAAMLFSVCLWQILFLLTADTQRRLQQPRRSRVKNYKQQSSQRTQSFYKAYDYLLQITLRPLRSLRFNINHALTRAFFSAPFVSLCIRGFKSTDLKSPMITGLGLCLLLRASEWWMFPLAGLLAIGSKFLIRYEGKHVFNPGNIAIVTLLLVLPRDVWISTGQWGSEVWTGFLCVCLGFLVLYRLPKADISLFFFASYAALLFIRCLWLGDPMAIPLHQIQSGALLIFTFFMISDPKTTPDHRLGRFIFALAVAAIAFTLQFGFQIREGAFYALALVSMATPMIDKLAPAPRYQWRNT